MLENQYRFISSSTVEFKPPKRQLGRQTQENDTLSPSSTASSAAPCTAVWEPPFLFSGPDMELFHHYMTCTSMTLADDEAGRKLMQSTLPQLGFRYNHVLRLLLAFAGYHVAHLRQRRRQDKQPEGEILSLSDTSDESVVTQADQNYTIALSQVRTDIPTLNETTCHAIYASAVFICFCSFAKGPQAGQYLGFSEDAGSAEWLTLLGGVRSIIQYSKDVLSVDLVSAEISNSSLDQYMGDPHADVEHPRAGWAGCLQQLRDLLIQEFSICHSSYAIYLTVLDGLASSFNKVYGTEHERLCRGDRWAQIFRWLYTLPGVFVSDLQEHRPPALLLFSPFVVLLKDLESYWFVHGWPEHILAGIYRMLSVRHRTFLTWQMEQVGWNP
ncbi:hypothetical protein BJY01DRAFT_230590 [Aspergillus pseudoustus]|uniref:Fungal-specific transcription factor domain-containing protein n=1 Tax=Aspergillus pseudoustus TaxID=1810923 RepID=A0ABR4I885_9EURO